MRIWRVLKRGGQYELYGLIWEFGGGRHIGGFSELSVENEIIKVVTLEGFAWAQYGGQRQCHAIGRHRWSHRQAIHYLLQEDLNTIPKVRCVFLSQLTLIVLKFVYVEY